MLEIRTLRADEREALLELLDDWALPDGWRGRDFFRRFVEDDPTYADSNVWVAEDAGALVSCAQVFPRSIRCPKGRVAMAGIGSVYTRPDRRGAGIATRVLRALLDDVTARGMEVSILFASRVSWYRQLGWDLWGPPVLALYPRPGPATPVVPVAVSDFDAERDLDGVIALHEAYSADLPGTVLRDGPLWEATLGCGGNPDERFLVSGPRGRPLAYLRATVIDGQPTLSEWGRTPGGTEALLALIDRVLAEGVPGSAGSDLLSLPGLPDAELRDALLERGHRLEERRPTLEPMLQCLAPQALSERFGVTGEPAAVARAVLPPERYFLWPADRF